MAAALLAFATAAITLALLLFGLALLIVTGQRRVIATLNVNTRRVKRSGGVVLVGVGLWTLALAIWADAFARFFPV